MGCKYGKKGLIISEVALIAAFFFKHTGFTFHEIALCLAIAVDFLITYLAVGEVRATLSTLVVESKNSMSQYLAKSQEFLESSESWAKLQQSLEEEIAKWKEEAEQRKIDWVALNEKMQLVESEIQLLIAQKESILEEAYSARKEAKEQLSALKMQMADIERAREEVDKKLETVANIEELAQAQELDFQSRIAAVEEQLRIRVGSIEKEHEEKLARAIDLKHSQIVSLEGELAIYKVRLAELEAKGLEESKRAIKESQERVADLEAELSSYKNRLTLLEEEGNEHFKRRIALLEEKLNENSHLNSELASYKSRLAELEERKLENQQLEAELASYKNRLAELGNHSEKTREYAQLEGLYKQLRSQFEEKSNALREARRELFQTETKLQALELERKMTILSDDHEEALRLQRELSAAATECEALEEEVIALEALVSHILSQ